MITYHNFQHWLDAAKPGARFTYHRGFLARAITVNARGEVLPSPGSPSSASHRLRALADDAHKAFQQQRVVLYQERNGDNDYSYVAIKR